MRYPCFGRFWSNAGSAYWMLGKKLLFIGGNQEKLGKSFGREKY